MLKEVAVRLAACVCVCVCDIVYHSGDDDVQDLMKKTDKAMHAMNAAGRNGYRFFAPVADG